MYSHNDVLSKKRSSLKFFP